MKPQEQIGFPCWRSSPSLNQVILRLLFDSAPRKKAPPRPTCTGVAEPVLGSKGISTSCSLLRLPLLCVDSHESQKVFNTSSLIPREMEPNSRWVSLQWSSATSPLMRGQRMLSTPVQSCLAKRLLSIMRYISQIDSRRESQPVVLEAETD